MYSINEVEETILKESDVKKLRCVEFNYKISGFIKEASRFFSTSACLSFAFYEYYYTISGSYNEITKKMYDEIITNEEVRNIFNKLTICILEDFEWFVRTYGKKDK